MSIFRILGPPGTGKTTALLDRVDRALEEGIDPKLIGYFAFTKQASREAVERACKRFNLTEDDLPWFRTLHSFALRLSGIRQEQIMQKEHYEELSDELGIELSGSKASDPEDLEDLSKNNNPFINLINLARLRKVSLREQYDDTHTNIDWLTLEYVARGFDNYRKQMDVYDFTDMLSVFVQENVCPRLLISFIDEAQDLSPLQWDVANIIAENSERTVCAGDDDQAIYRWAGADVEQFINLDGGYEVLEQSYRVPGEVHVMAERVVNRIDRRVPKVYKPREERGHVEHLATIWDLDVTEGSWLILAQSAYMLAPVVSMLRDDGHLFTYQGRRSISDKISLAINGWEQLRNGKHITGEAVKAIYSFMSVGDRVQRGFKKAPGVDDDDLYDMEHLTRHLGLQATTDMIWHDAMDKLPERDRAYITALLRRGEKFNAKPRIAVSTIHGSKGGEADNVAIFTDLSGAAHRDFLDNPDDTHRVFYVGVTRTRKNLYVIEPIHPMQSYII